MGGGGGESMLVGDGKSLTSRRFAGTCPKNENGQAGVALACGSGSGSAGTQHKAGQARASQAHSVLQCACPPPAKPGIWRVMVMAGSR